MTQRQKLIVWFVVVAAAVALVACSGASSNLGKYFVGRTLHLNVLTIERVPELRYATIDPEQVVRHWRIVPSGDELELILLRLKVENHTAISAIVDVDTQAAELRDFIRGTYFPVDLTNRLYQDIRNQPQVTVRMSQGQCFDPNRMYVSPGTTITWVSEGSEVNYVRLEPTGEEPVSIDPGETYSHTFGEAGTIDYECGATGLSGTAPTYQTAQIVVEAGDGEEAVEERSMVFIDGSFELLKDMGIDGWMVFEAPEGTKFRGIRWRAGDSITIDF